MPSARELEVLGYETAEIDTLVKAGRALNAVESPSRRNALGREILRKLWPDELEFIGKTHWIATKEAGTKKLLRPNYAQMRFYRDVIERCRKAGLPVRGITLKARQLGFSTFFQAWQYEQCDGSPLRSSLTVSYDDPTTMELFRKARMIHDHMWFPRPTTRRAARDMEFDNGSIFFARTAGNTRLGRSQTLHHVHLSETAMWDNAEEAITSVVQCVPSQPGTSIFYESTARGAFGSFYDAWVAAEDGRSPFVPFFAPWFWDEEYRLEFPDEEGKGVFYKTLGNRDRHYMKRHGLSIEQMRWRDWKIKELGGSRRRFEQEFPASPQEAFLTTGAPVFDPEKVMDLQSNVTDPYWHGDIVLVEGRR